MKNMLACIAVLLLLSGFAVAFGPETPPPPIPVGPGMPSLPTLAFGPETPPPPIPVGPGIPSLPTLA